MNSNSLFTTVLRNLQWALRNLGYCPTMYMMLDAMIAWGRAKVVKNGQKWHL